MNANSVTKSVHEGPVLAHHPEIQAEAVCDANGGLVINYVSTSWLTTGEPGSGNSQIDITINGVDERERDTR